MRILAPSAAGHAGDKTLQNTAENFCPFCFCCGWLARCAALAFFPLAFGPSGARARPHAPCQKTLLFTVFCCICVSGLDSGLFFLGCCFWGLWRARARPHVSLLGLGPSWAPESWHPRQHLGLGWATCITSHIVAQDTFLIQKA